MADPSVFQRIEKKYRIDASARRCIEGALGCRLRHDAQRDGLVTSLYLDTHDHSLICRSMEKPLYKEKLRLRAYGDEAGTAMMRAFGPEGARLAPGEAAQPVFLEMKMKLDGVGYKRRLALPLGAARLFLDGAALATALAAFPPARRDGALLRGREAQIGRELAALLRRRGPLEPSIAVRCRREAWVPASPEHPEVRVTFDAALEYALADSANATANVTAAMTDASLSMVSAGAAAVAAMAPAPSPFPAWRPLLGAGESIMEVKAGGAFPLWLVAALDDAGAFPRSFSKCGAALEAAMRAIGTSRPAATVAVAARSGAQVHLQEGAAHA